MASVNIILQQAGNNDAVTIDSPFISGITLSDGAPFYGEKVTLSATVTGDKPLTYLWSFTCGNSTFEPQAATTVLTPTDCQGDGEVTLDVSNGDIHSIVTFPLTYSPQGANVTVGLNNWPVIAGFKVPQAQLALNENVRIDIIAHDDETLSYTWSLGSACGTIAPFGDGSAANFTGTTAGDCTVTVKAEDGIGGKSTSSVILHVGRPSFVVLPDIDFSYCAGGPNSNNDAYGAASPNDAAVWSAGSLLLTKADACSGVGAALLVSPMPVISTLSFDVSACIGTAPRFNVWYGNNLFYCGCGADSTTPKTLTFGNPTTSCDASGINSGSSSGAPTSIEIVLDNQGSSSVSNIKVNGAAVP
jgi:hypothetical protein